MTKAPMSISISSRETMAEKRQPISTRYSDSGNRSFEWLKENYTWLAAMVVLVAGCLACLVIASMEGEAVARQYEERACQLRLELTLPMAKARGFLLRRS